MRTGFKKGGKMRKRNEKTKEKNKRERQNMILGCHNEDRASSISEILLLFSSQTLCYLMGIFYSQLDR